MKDHSHPLPVPPPRCAHDLAFCEKCNGPYCKTCGLEWVEKIHTTGLFQNLRDYERAQPGGGQKWPWSPLAPMPNPQYVGAPNPMDPRISGFPGSILCAHEG